MKLFFSMAAVVAVMTLVATPALADNGKRLWYSGEEVGAVRAALIAGDEVCMGSKKLHSCMMFNSFTKEINIQTVSRPIGVNQNTVTNRTLSATESGELLRVDGQLVSVISEIRGTNNAMALWTAGLAQVPATMVNGLGASLVQGLLNPCRGDSICNSTIIGVEGAQALSFSESSAGAQVGITSIGGGTCGSGGCPTGRKP